MRDRDAIRALPPAELLAHMERVWAEVDALTGLLDDDEHPWLGMDRDQRGNMISLIGWVLEGRPLLREEAR